MLKFKLFYLSSLSLLSLHLASAQDIAENTISEEVATKQIQNLSLAISFDYLKLHTLLIEESDKWEGSVNLNIREQFSIIGGYGVADLSPEETFRNAEYNSKGQYYRVGVDYHISVTQKTWLLLGLRYASSSFDEQIAYNIQNPIFPDETGTITRNNLNASWYEFVLTSEKNIQRILQKEIPDFLSMGFKFRIKALQDYDQFDSFEIKNIPGYGRTSIELNPEFNLYMKFRIPLF